MKIAIDVALALVDATKLTEKRVGHPLLMYSFESPILDHILSVDLTLSVVISGFVGMVKSS